MLCDKENPQNAPERNISIGDGRRRSSRSKTIEKQNADVPKKGIECTKKKAAKKKTKEDNMKSCRPPWRNILNPG